MSLFPLEPVLAVSSHFLAVSFFSLNEQTILCLWHQMLLFFWFFDPAQIFNLFRMSGLVMSVHLVIPIYFTCPVLYVRLRKVKQGFQLCHVNFGSIGLFVHQNFSYPKLALYDTLPRVRYSYSKSIQEWKLLRPFAIKELHQMFD